MWFDGKNKEQEKKQKTAVAVAYEPGDAAPKILAAGKGEVAERIIEKAKENDVPFYQDNKLAETLSKLQIGDTIPPELYDVVAEILVFVDGQLAGTAGISAVGKPCKLAHRAEFGIGILQAYWGQGIGYALTAACIDCARQAGYLQLELDVVADNARAIALYKKLGFVEYGRNPRGFRKRNGDYQELVYMRVEL